MKRAVIVMTAAAVSGIGISTARAAASSTSTPPAIHQVAGNAQSSVHSLASPSSQQIRDLFANVTTDALTQKDMARLIQHFDAAGQQRITRSATFSEGYGAKLDAQIEKFSQQWKQKYGHDFSINDPGQLLASSFASIQEGTTSQDPNLEKEVAKAAGQSADYKGLSGAYAVALAQVQSYRGNAEFQIPLVAQKAGQWTIETPQSLTAQTLRENLENQFSALSQRSDKWPAQESAACRMVTRHVLMAIMDRPMQAAAAPMPAHPVASAAKPAAPAQAAQKPQASIVKPTALTTTGGSHHWWEFWHW